MLEDRSSSTSGVDWREHAICHGPFQDQGSAIKFLRGSVSGFNGQVPVKKVLEPDQILLSAVRRAVSPVAPACLRSGPEGVCDP